MEYDEETILTRYICNHYQHLMTDFERKALVIISKRQMADAASTPEIGQTMRKKLGLMDDVEINKALANGYEVYRRHVRDRILKDHTEEAFINRCSRCNKVVRTPQAKLCLWCGYSWFEKM